jgi:hypothetical protein
MSKFADEATHFLNLPQSLARREMPTHSLADWLLHRFGFVRHKGR